MVLGLYLYDFVECVDVFVVDGGDEFECDCCVGGGDYGGVDVIEVVGYSGDFECVGF